MAVDNIGNAVSQGRLEVEQARLEASLRRAHGDSRRLDHRCRSREREASMRGRGRGAFRITEIGGVGAVHLFDGVKQQEFTARDLHSVERLPSASDRTENIDPPWARTPLHLLLQ